MSFALFIVSVVQDLAFALTTRRALLRSKTMSVNAWLMGPVKDQRQPCKRVPNVPVSLKQLERVGVFYTRLDPATMLDGGEKSAVAALMRRRGYKNRDEVRCSPKHLPNYEDKLKIFFEEHLHEDEEIRLVKEGSGYFDVRSASDEWIRIAVKPGDLIVLPAGIYHRFTLDDGNWIHAIRLFKDAPKWTALNRPCDDNPYRRGYVAGLVKAKL